MTDDEIKQFDKMLVGIAKHKSKRLVPTGNGEHLMMIPLVDVLAQIRAFTNYVKSKQKKDAQ